MPNLEVGGARWQRDGKGRGRDRPAHRSSLDLEPLDLDGQYAEGHASPVRNWHLAARCPLRDERNSLNGVLALEADHKDVVERIDVVLEDVAAGENECEERECQGRAHAGMQTEHAV